MKLQLSSCGAQNATILSENTPRLCTLKRKIPVAAIKLKETGMSIGEALRLKRPALNEKENILTIARKK